MAALDEQSVLDNVKTHLAVTDDIQDKVINGLIRRVVANFKRTYNVTTVNDTFDDIIEDCVIIRYNRIENEGMTSTSVEGHSISYQANDNEFARWDMSIRSILEADNSHSGGRVRFL